VRAGGALSLQSRVLVLVVINLAGWLLVAIGLSLRSGESIGSIVRHNFSTQFYVAYGYFALASLLTSYVLDGSPRGYLLATIVFFLSLLLPGTIAARRIHRDLVPSLTEDVWT